MPWIKVLSLEETTAFLKKEYEATQVIGYFNYINRIADGLGVQTEEFIREWEKSHEPTQKS
jgi:hypothetical protein